MSSIDTPTAAATAALLGLLLLTASAVPAVAATDTPVRLVGPDEPTAAGETTTVPVVVGNVDGGVGAYDLTVSVEDPNVATVVGAEVAGDAGARDVEVAPDGSNVSIRAALMDTADAGEVTVATVTVAGEAAGSTDVAVSVETLGDEEGRAYAVTAETGASVAVVDGADSTHQSTDDAAGASTDDSDSGDTGTDTSGDDTGSDTSGDDTGSDTSGDDTGSDTSGDDSETDTYDSDAGAESGSSSDALATELTTEPAGGSTETRSDTDVGGGFSAPAGPSELGAISAPAVLLLFAVLALLGGVTYLRRLR